MISYLINVLAALGVYAQTFIANPINVDVCRFYNATGHVWEEEAEDWLEGDIASAIMWDAGTPDDISDDSIIWLYYSGWNVNY